MKKSFIKVLFPLLCITFLVFSGCSKKIADSSSGNKAEQGAPPSYDTAIKGKQDLANTKSDNNLSNNTKEESKQTEGVRKIIQSANLIMETKEFDKTVNFITDSVTKENGYIQTSEITGGKSPEGDYKGNRTAHFVVRIPKDKLKAFLASSEPYGTILNSKISGDDITSNYFDTEARLKTLEIQEERLLTLLKKSEKIEDIIELEKRLSEIRYQIENLTGTLKKWDNLIELATVDISIREVQELKALKDKPQGYGDKIVNTFKDSVSLLYSMLKNLLLALIAIIPYALLGALIYLLLRKFIKKNFKFPSMKAKTDNPPSKDGFDDKDK